MNTPPTLEETALAWAKDVSKKIALLKSMDPDVCSRVMAGLTDGMALRTVPYPGGVDLPGLRPSFDAPYERGYDVGSSYAMMAQRFNREPNKAIIESHED